MYSKNDNIEIIINDKVDENKEELFKSLKNRYQNNLKQIKDSNFMFAIFTVLMYFMYAYPRNFKFKQKYQQDGQCFQTVSPFLMTMVLSISAYFFIDGNISDIDKIILLIRV